MLQGLTTAEAVARQQQFGPNTLQDAKKDSFIKVLFSKLNDALTILLLVAATISFSIGDHLEGALIMVIVILNALFSVYQEKKATDAVALLKKLSVTVVRVMRDGREQEIESTLLVPGDIFYVEEGSKIVADGKFVEGKNLELNESVLTGESLPVPKKMGEEVFTGTVVSRGRGYIEVVTIGMETKFGHITKNLSAVKEPATPLERKLKDISRKIGIIGIAISLLVFGLTIYSGGELGFALLMAISLAVALVPEGLPAVLTITLGVGVKEMAKKNAIVRKMSAIEAIGNVTLIATDKTGTLTTGNMSVKEIYVDGNVYHEEHPQTNNHPFSKLLLIGMVDSTASLVPVHGKERLDVLGDTTEGAVLNLAHKLKQSYENARRDWKLLDESPFDSITKLMSVVASYGKDTLLLTKGAPEAVLGISTHIAMGEKSIKMTEEHKKEIAKTMDHWASKGYRVIGFSYKEVNKSDKKPIDEETKNMTFAGLVALYDPPRPEVQEALIKAAEAGIRVVMVTGDNARTAETIATEIGMMKKGDEVLTGAQVDGYSDEQLMALLPRTRVFARTTPMHKSRIVSLYQKLGEIVAVTGDGVNDAIALKQANVGIAMGRDGTDVARDTAAIVLADDNFATIIYAVEQGRRIVKNFSNSLIYLMAGNLSEAMTLIAGLLLGIRELFFPIQLLYINLMSDGLPALALAFTPISEDIMKRPPQRELQLLDGLGKKFVGIVAVLITIVVLSSYFWFLGRYDEHVARTIAFIMLDIAQAYLFVMLWNAYSDKNRLAALKAPLFWFGFITPIVGQFILNKVAILASVMHIVTLSNELFALTLLISAIPVLVYSAGSYAASRFRSE